MPMEHGDDLMKALIAKLYATITGDDDTIKIPRNKYVSWFLPGVPFDPADFRYCATGFAGNTAEEIRNSYHQAFVLSSLFDYIPDTSTGFLEPALQQSIFAGTGDRISTVYKDVLKYSRVLDRPLSDTEVAKLKKFRDLLAVEVEETNLVTDEKTTVSRPGKLTVAYTQKMDEYLSIADELLNMKIDALAATGNDPESRRRVFTYNEKAKFVRKRLEAAEMAWISQGYRNEYQTINAYIDQVTEKSLVLYKQDLKRKFEAALTTSVVDGGSDFYYTTLLPGNFATSPGWTKFTFAEIDAETHQKGETTGWGASAGVGFGLFSFGASASGSKTEGSQDQSQKNFTASFEFTQIPICRPWFEPGFFSMRSWTLDDNWNLSYGDRPVSDGKAEGNTGRLVAYATSALFVRNVRLTSSSWSQHADFMKKSISMGGTVGYGPFTVGGSYSKGSEAKNTSYHFDGDTLCIDGMQLIGTINNIIPQSPNTDPRLKPEDFVGGA
jgi:hypothetical protein